MDAGNDFQAMTHYNINRLPQYAESLLVHFRRAECLKRDCRDFSSIVLNSRQLCDLELLLNRAFYPLDGYMNREDYACVLDRMRLADGTVWPLPICLDVDGACAEALEPGRQVAIRDEEGFMLAVMEVEEKWRADKRAEAISVFGTDDPDRHPGVHHLFNRVKDWYVSGKLEGIQLPHHYDFQELRLSPSDANRIYSQRGWRNVVGFQTEKLLHCAHKEMIISAAREAGASIFLQPAVGRPGLGDLGHFALMRCYQAFVKQFPRNMILLGLVPLAARRAGPRDALLQAIVRKSYGCTHSVVAEDEGDPYSLNGESDRFYPAGAAQETLARFQDEIGITMIPLRKMVYVEDVQRYLPESEVLPGMKVMEISSAELRRRLEMDIAIPEWFSFPEVVSELKKAWPPRYKQGFTIFITGLSGAGKSTLAKILYVRFMEINERPVTLLDGDIVRRHISNELTFSREHRNINIERIGFVASEITKNRGVAICAPIAPYAESRRSAREIVSRYGGFIEVYLSTPLDVCETRDRKGIYAKARAGIMKGVTGIDDPYVPPVAPEVTIDTSQLLPTEAAQMVMLYLEEQGYVR
jgi:sulfate adenylyltransferase